VSTERTVIMSGSGSNITCRTTAVVEDRGVALGPGAQAGRAAIQFQPRGRSELVIAATEHDDLLPGPSHPMP
jgi:hypothetical protein